MTKTGHAAAYDAPNKPFKIQEFPVRDVLSDEVVVRITMSTICRSDIHSYQGYRPNLCPGILGHEIVGIIEQLGQNMTHDMRGDPLAISKRVTWTEFFTKVNPIILTFMISRRSQSECVNMATI